MTSCDPTVGLLIGLCIVASFHARQGVTGHLAAVLPWLTLAIATADGLALGIAAAHAVGAYLLFVRAQGTLVRDAFALAEGGQAGALRAISWKSRVPLRVLHPVPPLPR